MTITEEQQKFIHAWGTLGSNWGINKTMAQIHALLLLSEKAMSTEEMMETLQVSRGNVNMNVRALIDWGLAQKESALGDRKDYFLAKKDIWVIARQIANQRRKRELEPVLNLLSEIKQSPNAKNPENKELNKRVRDIEDFTLKIDKVLEKFEKSDESWFYKMLLKMV